MLGVGSVSPRDSLWNSMKMNLSNVLFKKNLARNGMFCYPKDEKIKDQLLVNSNLKQLDDFMRSLDMILICM